MRSSCAINDRSLLQSQSRVASLAVHGIGYLDPHFVRPYTLRSAHAYEVYGWLSLANKGPMYGQATTSMYICMVRSGFGSMVSQAPLPALGLVYHKSYDNMATSQVSHGSCHQSWHWHCPDSVCDCERLNCSKYIHEYFSIAAITDKVGVLNVAHLRRYANQIRA